MNEKEPKSEQQIERERQAEVIALWINNTKTLLDLARSVATYDPKTLTVQQIATIARDRARLIATAVDEINKTLEPGEHLSHSYWGIVAPHLYLET